MVRIVGRDNINEVTPWLSEWAGIVAGWIQAGLEPSVFTHTPDDGFAPQMAEAFHNLLALQLPGLPTLPEWPGRAEQSVPRQRSLF